MQTSLCGNTRTTRHVQPLFRNGFKSLSDDQDINGAWENIKKNNKTSAKDSIVKHELKQHKSWFDEECLYFLDNRKHSKMQWVQNTSHSNVGNLNSVRLEAIRYNRE